MPNYSTIRLMNWSTIGKHGLSMAFLTLTIHTSACSGLRVVVTQSDQSDEDDAADYNSVATLYYYDFGDVNDADFMHAARSGKVPSGPFASRVFTGKESEPGARALSASYYAVETRREAFPYNRVLLDGAHMICTRYSYVRGALRYLAMR